MTARAVALLGTLALTALAGRARAEEAPSPPPPSPPPPVPALVPPPAPAESESTRAALERQAAAIEELRVSLDEEKRAREREHLALRVSGYVQADWVVHDQQSLNEIDGSTGQPLNRDRFTLRRGHVRLDAQRGLVAGALEIDANTTSGPQVRPINAEVSLRWPEAPDERAPSLMLSMGLLRTPFGFEVQELDYVRPFLERALVMQALFPGEFDLGARFKGQWRFASLALGLMNGSPIGSKTFPDLDPTRTKDLVGRVGVDVEIAAGIRFQAGASAVTGLGFHAGTPTTKDTLVWQDSNGDGVVQPNEVQVIAGSSSTASQTFRRFAVGGDARLIVRLPALGDLALRAEVVRSENLDRGVEVADPVGARHDLRELGWSLGATQEITKWAMIGARYDRYDPDADASRQLAVTLVPSDRSYGTLALMAMARYESARLVLEYDARSNSLGRDASGAPSTLAADTLTLRGQMVFP